jgi:signal transduction histidine kinase
MLAQVPTLVDESRAAKLRVACRIDVREGAAVPATIERTAYRIVQEGLTNARKHARGNATVSLTIASAGRRCLTVVLISRSPAGALRVAPPPGAGAGLIGLSERVALAGGRLQHGLDPDGSFALRATLPWPP